MPGSFGRAVAGCGMTISPNPYRGFRFPSVVIEHAVWLYRCFSFSFSLSLAKGPKWSVDPDVASEFARDSPLEGTGFEPSVPRPRSRTCASRERGLSVGTSGTRRGVEPTGAYASGRRARAVEFSTAIRIAIAENNKASGHGRALHVKRRTRVAQTPIYRYDGEHAAMMRQTQLALPREPVRRRGAQTVEWPRVIVDGKANNDQHALRRRASPLQRGRSSG